MYYVINQLVMEFIYCYGLSIYETRRAVWCGPALYLAIFI